MGEPAAPIRRRLELSVAEARLRFQQLVRVTGLTGQVTVVMEGGRPIAAIVPPGDVLGAGPAPPSLSPAPRPEPPSLSPAPRSELPPSRRGPRSELPPSVHGSWAGDAASVPAPRSDPGRGEGESAAAGWMRRIEKVREDVRRQHAGRIRELSQALDEAWRLLDEARPPGTDRAADTLRAAHADLRHSR
ncbi:hypothetical protein [Actinoplanes sp. GCM10030250]|uniref:hypothetical protein n=1 Tax=Actinoplanes sp. GCM10030250 TaxID=3273376 RepID=UPI003607BDF3